MGNWSVYVSPDEEDLLKKKIQEVADKNRWSFSQAVSVILKEHLIEEKKRVRDEESWAFSTTQSFFDGYSEKDNVYDTL